jgi:hypothetical protein
VLYAFGNEAVAEIRNRTAHGSMALALVPRAGGYTLYIAVYVKPVSRLTPLYLAVIEPFRRFIVYPALCRGARRSWARAYGQTIPILGAGPPADPAARHAVPESDTPFR